MLRLSLRAQALSDLLDSKLLYDRWFEILGFEIHVRIRPASFRKDESRIARLIDEEHFDEAEAAIKTAIDKWGRDPDLTRLELALDFERSTFEQ